MKQITFKISILFLLIVSGVCHLAAQNAASVDVSCGCESNPSLEVLAVVNGIKIGKNDLSAPTAQKIRELQEEVVNARKNELNLIVNSKLLDAEAKKRGITVGKLLEQEVVSKVKEPTEAEAQAFYDENKARIQDSFPAVKAQIISYLREQGEQAAAKAFAERLRAAANVKMLVEFAAPPASAADRSKVLATVNAVSITSGDVEDNLRPLIFEVQKQVYELRKNDVDLKINDMLLIQEAQKRKITARALLDAEINNKIPAITEAQAQAFYNENKARINGEFQQIKQQIIEYLRQQEENKLNQAFAAQLRRGATIQIFLTEPAPPVYQIPISGQPVKGSANAAVTIVEFMDFQCPACAETHAVLNRLVGEYQGKVKLALLDYPLTQHAEAFKAAEAAEAAREQGKFWEYADILYRNQSALGVPKLKDYAAALGLDRQKFDKALDEGLYAEKIQNDLLEGSKTGVNSTPTIFVNGRMVADRSYETLKAAIEKELRNQR